jgi:cytochrome b
MARVVQVWDLPVRLFHWLLVVLLVVSFTTGKLGGNWLAWHFRSGYCILALVLFRIIWGVAGSQTARFSDFIKGPEGVFTYARSLIRGAGMFHAGHNPMGGLMIVLMLVLLLVQATTGLFVDDDNGTRAPLADKARCHRQPVHNDPSHQHQYPPRLRGAACLRRTVLPARQERQPDRPDDTGRRPFRQPSCAGAIRDRPALVIVALTGAFVAWLVLVYPR